MVTVDAAIKKGRVQLYWIPLSLMYVGFILLCLLSAIGEPESTLGRVCVVCGYLWTFLLPLIYYLLMLPRWRIWALSNVRNVHELRHVARLRHMYPEKNSFLWRLAIKSTGQIAALEQLEQKFDQPDVFEDDYSTPYQTKFFQSKSDKLFLPLFAIGSIVAAIIFLSENNLFAGLIMLPGVIVAGIIAFTLSRKNTEFLILSDDGITTQEYGFHAWRDIQNEQVVSDTDNDFELRYVVNSEHFKIPLRFMRRHRRFQVDRALRAYRGRYRIQHR